MNAALMNHPHHSSNPIRPWAWALAPGVAARIEAAAVPRWLVVKNGRVWLTPTRDDALAEDVWLAAGDAVHLSAGISLVLEGWPSAELALLLEAPPPVRRRRAGVSAWAPWQYAARRLRAWTASLSAPPARPAAPAAPRAA
jgi:hypothetical protein